MNVRHVGQRRGYVPRPNNLNKWIVFTVGPNRRERRLVSVVEDEATEIGVESMIGRVLLGAEKGEHFVVGQVPTQVVVKVLRIY